jgi:hypothetical protein
MELLNPISRPRAISSLSAVLDTAPLAGRYVSTRVQACVCYDFYCISVCVNACGGASRTLEC